MKFFVTLFILTSSLSAKEAVIYGEDNRRDIYEVTNSLHLKLAQSTAAMIDARRLKIDREKNTLSFLAYNLERTQNLCQGESFAEQISLSDCSGFLIGEDLLVTAGHCMAPSFEGDDPCKRNVWAFGFEMKSSTELGFKNFDIYACKKLEAAALDEKRDFAVIRLDRKVKGRTPLKFRTSGKIAKDADLVVIGHPSGLPSKIADGGEIIDNSGETSFIASLDTFSGNSGSAVFDSKTGLLEGILTEGKTDYVPSRPYDPFSCQVVNKCNQKGTSCSEDPELDIRKGETVLRITALFKK